MFHTEVFVSMLSSFLHYPNLISSIHSHRYQCIDLSIKSNLIHSSIPVLFSFPRTPFTMFYVSIHPPFQPLYSSMCLFCHMFCTHAVELYASSLCLGIYPGFFMDSSNSLRFWRFIFMNPFSHPSIHPVIFPLAWV